MEAKGPSELLAGFRRLLSGDASGLQNKDTYVHLHTLVNQCCVGNNAKALSEVIAELLSERMTTLIQKLLESLSDWHIKTYITTELPLNSNLEAHRQVITNIQELRKFREGVIRMGDVSKELNRLALELGFKPTYEIAEQKWHRELAGLLGENLREPLAKWFCKQRVPVNLKEKAGTGTSIGSAAECEVEYSEDQVLTTFLRDMGLCASTAAGPLLFVAVKGESDSVSQLLLQPDLDPNFGSLWSGETPLHAAVQLGNDAIVKQLLASSNQMVPLNVNCRGGMQARTPLELAVILKQQHIVCLLARDRRTDITLHDASGVTALQLAVRTRNAAALKEMLSSSDEVDANIRELYGDKHSLLHIAVQSNDLGILQQLLDHKGIDLLIRDSSGATPLDLVDRPYLSAMQQALHRALRWLAARLDLPAMNQAHAALGRHTARLNSRDIKKALHKALREQLITAAVACKYLLLKSLLEASCDADRRQRKQDRESLLHLAAQGGSMKVQAAITGEEAAAEKESRDCIILLWSYGLSMDARDVDGNTPVRYMTTACSEWWRKECFDRSNAAIAASNTFLLGAVLIATVTYTGVLSPATGYTITPLDSAVLGFVDVAGHRGSLGFFVLNALAFYLAITTVLVAACVAMPQPRRIEGEGFEKQEQFASLASFLLLLSALCAVGAFAAASFADLPPQYNHVALTVMYPGIVLVVLGSTSVFWRLASNLAAFVARLPWTKVYITEA